MDDKLTIAIWVIGAAVVLQMLLLAGMFFTLRKLSTRLHSLAADAESRVFPLLTEAKPALENLKSLQHEVKGMLEASRPKLDTILDNVANISTTARTDLQRIDVTLHDLLDRVRLQTIRVDEMVTRTIDKVEETGEKVQHTVLSPVRQVSGILSGLSAGMGAFFTAQKRTRNGAANDEMFI
jgi:methyl-accepting chemotaxis protein